MARAGGICTFLMLGLLVVGLVLALVAQRSVILAGIGGILVIVAFAIWFFVMIAIKVDLDLNGYSRTGAIVWTILGVTILALVVGIVGASLGGQASRGEITDLASAMRSLGIWGIVVLLMTIAIQFLFLMLGVRFVEYGAIGGGVWKGAGIVLIIAASLGLIDFLIYVVAMLTRSLNLVGVGGILGFVDMLVWLAAWVMIGIGFMADANRRAAQNIAR